MADSYARRTTLFPAEEALIPLLRRECAGKPLLDLGVGPGRTVPYLTGITSHYFAIDYSRNMVEPGRASLGDYPILLCDARRLCFPPSTFQAVVWFNSALDDFCHTDRLNMLGEIHAVLRPGGLLVVSAHNLDARIRSPFKFRLVRPENGEGIIRFTAARLKRYAAGIANHLNLRRHEIHAESYSIINDQTYNYRLLTYYMTMARQIAQFESLGFEFVTAVSEEGQPVTSGEKCGTVLIHYVARKLADCRRLTADR